MKVPSYDKIPFFGGWSVLSSNGSTLDGWLQGGKLLISTKENPVTPEQRKQLIKHFDSYTVPTEICCGYLAEVIQKIRDLGLSPRRARITRLSASGVSDWHYDAAPSDYSVRLHVPIITNPKCFFQTRGGAEHFEANGLARIIYVNQEHRVLNQGDTDRFHLIMDITDSKGITQFHSEAAFAQRLQGAQQVVET